MSSRNLIKRIHFILNCHTFLTIIIRCALTLERRRLFLRRLCRCRRRWRSCYNDRGVLRAEAGVDGVIVRRESDEHERL